MKDFNKELIPVETRFWKLLTGAKNDKSNFINCSH